MTKIFVVEYPLSRGVYAVEAEIETSGYACIRDGDSGICFPPQHYCLSWQEAKQVAEAIRDEKIAELRNQIARLSAMTWDQPDD